MARMASLVLFMVFLASTSWSRPRVSVIEWIEAEMDKDKAFAPEEKKRYLASLRQQLGAYAFDVRKGTAKEGAEVLLSIITKGSFDEVALERTVRIASAAYVAISRGAPPGVVEGIALYGFRKQLEAEKIEAWANGYRDCVRFGVPPKVAEDLVWNAAEQDWDLDSFHSFKWGLVQAAKAEYNLLDFAVYLFGHHRAGDIRPGAMVSRALRSFREASRTGSRPDLPAYTSPVLDFRGGSETIETPPKKPPDDPGTNVKASRERILSRMDKTIQSFLGTPYVWGGHTRQGTDCSGFVQAVFAEAGIDLPRGSIGQFRFGREVTRSELRKGDLVFFRTRRDQISHVGIVSDPARGHFAHASSSRGVVISNLKSKYYRYRYAGARRVIPF